MEDEIGSSVNDTSHLKTPQFESLFVKRLIQPQLPQGTFERDSRLLEDTFAAIDDQGDAPVQRTMQSTVINLQDLAEVEKRHERREQREKQLEELTKVSNQPPINGIAE
jgi:hypothetical protein